MKAIDDKIQNLWLPNIISRIPRCIEYQLGAWEGTEICLFLLSYSIPILFDCLPQDYLQHYILLAELMFLLLKDSISYEELAKSSHMLKHFCDFCVRIHSLYGKRYYTCNMHNLLHLAYIVCQLGPLWMQSAFWYKDYNGDYKNLFHSTQNGTLQIVTNVVALQKIPEISRALVPGTVAHKLCNQMTKKCHQSLKNLGESILCGVNTVVLLQQDTLTAEEDLIITFSNKC